jgi:large subunit ribosomal protein L10
MNRDQKAHVIETFKNDFQNSTASFVIGYKGLTVKQLQTLRKELRQQKGKFKVAKGRLIKRAVEGMEGISELSPYFKEQIGVVFALQEPPQVAKVLHDFAKKNEGLRLVAGFFDEHVVSSAAIEKIASLPSREVLLAQVCGTLEAPISNLARVLNMQLLQLLFTLKQIQEKKQ